MTALGGGTKHQVLRSNFSVYEPLVIFVGGGGAGSEWYIDSIHSTWEDFRDMKILTFQIMS